MEEVKFYLFVAIACCVIIIIWLIAHALKSGNSNNNSDNDTISQPDPINYDAMMGIDSRRKTKGGASSQESEDATYYYNFLKRMGKVEVDKLAGKRIQNQWWYKSVMSARSWEEFDQATNSSDFRQWFSENIDPGIYTGSIFDNDFSDYIEEVKEETPIFTGKYFDNLFNDGANRDSISGNFVATINGKSVNVPYSGDSMSDAKLVFDGTMFPDPYSEYFANTDNYYNQEFLDTCSLLNQAIREADSQFANWKRENYNCGTEARTPTQAEYNLLSRQEMAFNHMVQSGSFESGNDGNNDSSGKIGSGGSGGHTEGYKWGDDHNIHTNYLMRGY